MTAEQNRTSDILKIAEGYFDRGWWANPMPLGREDSQFSVRQSRRLKREELPAHFGGQCNIGVRLGDLSGGLVDIVLHHPIARELADKYLLPTNP